jgi:hypothetical protein
MISVRILTAALLICTASAFAQEQLSSTTRPNGNSEPEKSARATTSEPWRIVLSEPADLSAEKNTCNRRRLTHSRLTDQGSFQTAHP